MVAPLLQMAVMGMDIDDAVEFHNELNSMIRKLAKASEVKGKIDFEVHMPHRGDFEITLKVIGGQDESGH